MREVGQQMKNMFRNVFIHTSPTQNKSFKLDAR